jgi:hypothetical protein
LEKIFELSKACPVQGVLWHKKQKSNIFIRKKLEEEMFLWICFQCFKHKMAALRPPFSPE